MTSEARKEPGLVLKINVIRVSSASMQPQKRLPTDAQPPRHEILLPKTVQEPRIL